MDLSIVIPCYNEKDSIVALEQALFPVVDSLRRTSSVEVILVDDDSQDGTGDLLRALALRHAGVVLLSHERNQGLGMATRTGFARARGDAVVVTDGDGTYPFTEIPKILALLRGPVDIVSASPCHPQGGIEGVPGYRIFLSQGASLLYRILLKRDIHTYTAMFRAYRRKVVREVPSAADGFLMPAELLSNAILLGYRVAEYPSALHVRRYGQSKAKLWRIVRAYLGFQLDLLWRRLSGSRPAGAEGSLRG